MLAAVVQSASAFARLPIVAPSHAVLVMNTSFTARLAQLPLTHACEPVHDVPMLPPPFPQAPVAPQ